MNKQERIERTLKSVNKRLKKYGWHGPAEC